MLGQAIVSKTYGFRVQYCHFGLKITNYKTVEISGTTKSDTLSIDSMSLSGIFDLLVVKLWGMKYAVNAAATILRVDQIIMAKRAGGPKAKSSQGPMDSQDDD